MWLHDHPVWMALFVCGIFAATIFLSIGFQKLVDHLKR